MSDLYLKITNDIKEDVLLCYIYSNTGACYGVKYSPNNSQLSVVILNSRQTSIESEQSGSEIHQLFKDDLVHIYTDTTAGPGKFLVSSIHNNEEVAVPSPFILQAKNDEQRVDFDSDPFSFAGLSIDELQDVNIITEISEDEYYSRILTSEIISTTTDEVIISSTDNDSEATLDTSSTSDHVSESLISESNSDVLPEQNKPNGGKGVFGVLGIVILLTVAFVLLAKKGTLKSFKQRIRDHKGNINANHPKYNDTSSISSEYSIVKQTYLSNKALLAHSLIKNEDLERTMNIMLTRYKECIYYKNQSASKIICSHSSSLQVVPNTPFIIAMTVDWELVVAQHGSNNTIKMDVFNEMYLMNNNFDLDKILSFLSSNITNYQYNNDAQKTPASAFFSLLCVLLNRYQNDVMSSDTRVKSILREFDTNADKWNCYFVNKLPKSTKEAIIRIAELIFMKSIATREISGRWEDMVECLSSIKNEMDDRHKEATSALENTQLLSSTTQNTPTVVRPSSQDSASNCPMAVCDTTKPQQTTTRTNYVTVRSQMDAQQVGNSATQSILSMYTDAMQYFKSQIPPDFCKPASDVTAYHITTPYKLVKIENKSRPAIPEFILIGVNLYPNPYRYKNGIIKTEEINRLILDSIFDLSQKTTGMITHISPATVDLSRMVIVEKGRIELKN